MSACATQVGTQGSPPLVDRFWAAPIASHNLSSAYDALGGSNATAASGPGSPDAAGDSRAQGTEGWSSDGGVETWCSDDHQLVLLRVAKGQAGRSWSRLFRVSCCALSLRHNDRYCWLACICDGHLASAASGCCYGRLRPGRSVMIAGSCCAAVAPCVCARSRSNPLLANRLPWAAAIQSCVQRWHACLPLASQSTAAAVVQCHTSCSPPLLSTAWSCHAGRQRQGALPGPSLHRV